MNVTRLQELYSQALARRDPAGTDACVSPEELLALVRTEGPEARRLESLDHVMGCPACRREFDLLRALGSAQARPANRPSLAILGRRFTPLALAASLLLAIGVGLAVRSRVQPDDTVRGGDTKLVLVAPSTEVPPGPLTFVWQRIPGAQRYQIELLDADGNLAFSQATGDTSLTWPADQLRPGSAYRWWVRDLTPGSQLASPLRPLRVRPK
jgi:hypothetical protein